MRGKIIDIVDEGRCVYKLYDFYIIQSVSKEVSMQAIFESINNVFAFIGPLSDFLWDFPEYRSQCGSYKLQSHALLR